MRKRSWKVFAVEFLSVFFAVTLAFALNKWNDNRNNRLAENKILLEIKNGLEKDYQDVKLNILGHNIGLNGSNYWRKTLEEKQNSPLNNKDSIKLYYFNFLRDFIAIQNTSGYENLKSRGLELITNDSLRSKIITLYEYDYQLLYKLEEEYTEMQFHQNYFKPINDVFAPHFVFDKEGNITSLNLPITLPDSEKKKIYSYFWKIDKNRNFILEYYKVIQQKILDLKTDIEKEL